MERRNGIALWRQIADNIRTDIGSGVFDEARKLTPEHELARRFGVNRHTVREAIASLVHEGVLRSEQGRGTFVQQRRRFAYPIGPRTRFSTGRMRAPSMTAASWLSVRPIMRCFIEICGKAVRAYFS